MTRRVRFIAVHPVNVRHVPSSSIVIRISSYLSIATSAVIGIIGDVVIGCCLLQFTAVRCTCSLCQTHCSPRGLSWRAHHALQALGLLVVSAARDIFLYPPLRASQRVAGRPCVSRIKNARGLRLVIVCSCLLHTCLGYSEHVASKLAVNRSGLFASGRNGRSECEAS